MREQRDRSFVRCGSEGLTVYIIGVGWAWGWGPRRVQVGCASACDYVLVQIAVGPTRRRSPTPLCSGSMQPKVVTERQLGIFCRGESRDSGIFGNISETWEGNNPRRVHAHPSRNRRAIPKRLKGASYLSDVQ